MDDWVIVPREPTKAMLDAADKEIDLDPYWIARAYHAMLDAAPQQHKEQSND